MEDGETGHCAEQKWREDRMPFPRTRSLGQLFQDVRPLTGVLPMESYMTHSFLFISPEYLCKTQNTYLLDGMLTVRDANHWSPPRQVRTPLKDG
jgi:hypothetical protein